MKTNSLERQLEDGQGSSCSCRETAGPETKGDGDPAVRQGIAPETGGQGGSTPAMSLAPAQAEEACTCTPAPVSRRAVLKGVGVSVGAALGSLALPTGPLQSLFGRGTALAANGTPGQVEYREIPRSGLRLSTVGLGAGNLRYTDREDIVRIVNTAMDHGINFMDLLLPYGPYPQVEAIQACLRSRRDKMVVQVHVGALFRNGQYTRSRSVRLISRDLEHLLPDFGGYFDIALIHYVDDESDFEEVVNDGLLAHMQKMQQAGTVRSLGFSTHSVSIARKFLATGAFDVFMFSLNPAYDFDERGGHLVMDRQRAELYQETARAGVGIVCMKTYGGGRLLDARTSPFGQAMTPAQCIQYALDRPAVISCPVGISSMEDLQSALAYYTASREERSYAFLGRLQNADVAGSCVYCNHCLPCPANIDIGAAMKFYDLALAGDEFARDHYRKLARTAADCIYCGRCEPNCPFNVKIMDRMKAMTAFFARG